MVSLQLSGWKSCVLRRGWGWTKGRIPLSNLRHEYQGSYLGGISTETPTIDSSTLVASLYIFCVFHESRDVSCFILHPIISPAVCCVPAKSPQLCPTLCDPMDCSPPGSSVHGILQARILEWAAMPSSRESSRPRDGTCVPYVSCIGRQVLYH